MVKPAYFYVDYLIPNCFVFILIYHRFLSMGVCLNLHKYDNNKKKSIKLKMSEALF